jgi:hypothetical protein
VLYIFTHNCNLVYNLYGFFLFFFILPFIVSYNIFYEEPFVVWLLGESKNNRRNENTYLNE